MEIRTIELESQLIIIKNNHKIVITPQLTDEPGNIRIVIKAPFEIGVDREEIYKLKQENPNEEIIKKENREHSLKKIQLLFGLLITVTCKSEKLEHAAKLLFNRNKILTPKTLEKIALGEKTTTAWIVTCAIDVLIHEKPMLLKKLLSTDDLYLMWAKPLLQSNTKLKDLLTLAAHLDSPELIQLINNKTM